MKYGLITDHGIILFASQEAAERWEQTFQTKIGIIGGAFIVNRMDALEQAGALG